MSARHDAFFCHDADIFFAHSKKCAKLVRIFF